MSHKYIISIFLVSVLIVTNFNEVKAEQSKSNGTSAAHVHLSLITIGAMSLSIDNVKALISEMASNDFLKTYGHKSDNLFAPCSLLSSALLSVKLNAFWWQIINKQIPPLPPGTAILGMYDKELRKGNLARLDTEIQADIMARLFIWHSWSTNAPINTLIGKLSQQQCLDKLLSNELESFMEALKISSTDLEFKHYQPVEIYSPTFSKEETEKYLAEVRNENLSELSSTESSNPLMPCSLLKAFRYASPINTLWGRILTGKAPVPPPNTLLIGKYSEELKDGRIPTSDPQMAVEITAGYFAIRTFGSNVRTKVLVSTSKQDECLKEIFTPGLIRKRLQREGIIPKR